MVTGLFKNKVEDSSLYEEGEIGGAGEGGEGHGGLRERAQELLFRALCFCLCYCSSLCCLFCSSLSQQIFSAPSMHQAFYFVYKTLFCNVCLFQ